MKVQQNSFNPSSNDLLVPKIQHLRAAVPRPEVLFVTRKKKKKSFIKEMGRSHRHVTKRPGRILCFVDRACRYNCCKEKPT
jgi:hypothetical protein